MHEAIGKQEELKPCPFCGGKAELKKARMGSGWQVVCAEKTQDCEVIVETLPCHYQDQAIAAWNRRQP